MKIEGKSFSPSGDIPLPLALRWAYEWEGKKIEEVLKYSDKVPEKLLPLIFPLICFLAGLKKESVKSTLYLILGLRALKREEIPPPSHLEKNREEFLRGGGK